jgi:hypothetical protein
LIELTWYAKTIFYYPTDLVNQKNGLCRLS